MLKITATIISNYTDVTAVDYNALFNMLNTKQYTTCKEFLIIFSSPNVDLQVG